MRTQTKQSDSSRAKVVKTDLAYQLKSLENRMKLANRSTASIHGYLRSVSRLSKFHQRSPVDFELDELMDFFIYKKDPYLCSKCKRDTMVVFKLIAGIRGSPRKYFAKDKRVKLEVN